MKEEYIEELERLKSRLEKATVSTQKFCKELEALESKYNIEATIDWNEFHGVGR